MPTAQEHNYKKLTKVAYLIDCGGHAKDECYDYQSE